MDYFMDVSHFKLDAARVHRAIQIDKENHALIAKETVEVYVPEHYFNGKLGTIDEEWRVVGIIAWVVDGKYAKSLVNSMISFIPEETNIVKIDDVNYFIFTWSPGSVITRNYNLPQKQSLVFEIYDEIVAKGKQPWYMKHLDRAELFYSAPKFAGVNLGASQSMQSIFCASCMRDPTDRSKPARESFETQDDYLNAEIDVIPLRSVAFGADNAASRLLGSYLNTGVVSELVNPSETAEEIETLLRM